MTDWETVAKRKERGRNVIACNLWTLWARHGHILFFLYYGKVWRLLVAIILLSQENTHSRYCHYSHFTDKATKSQSSE